MTRRFDKPSHAKRDLPRRPDRGGPPTAPRPPALRLDVPKITTELLEVLDPILQSLQLELIAIEIRPAGLVARVALAIDRLPGRGGVKLEDCARVSRKLSAALDARELAGKPMIAGEYELEVSSPGMHRVLRHAADLRRFAGMTAKILIAPYGEKETVTGVIETVTDEAVALRVAPANPKKGIDGLRRLALTEVVEMHLAPTIAEWTQLGQRLAAEAAAIGEPVEHEPGLDDLETEADLDGEDLPETAEE